MLDGKVYTEFPDVPGGDRGRVVFLFPRGRSKSANKQELLRICRDKAKDGTDAVSSAGLKSQNGAGQDPVA